LSRDREEEVRAEREAGEEPAAVEDVTTVALDP
jgi:hypothetical protein